MDSLIQDRGGYFTDEDGSASRGDGTEPSLRKRRRRGKGRKSVANWATEEEKNAMRRSIARRVLIELAREAGGGSETERLDTLNDFTAEELIAAAVARLEK